MVSKSKNSPILCVVGARPNFMKIAPVIAALCSEPHSIPVKLLHTGQHYDEKMKDALFTQLKIPEPDIDLAVGSASHAVQTAEIMLRFEPVLDSCKPAAILVVGDVNSTIACALVASKKHIPVIHVEAGLRSYDRNMPEEINRVLTDQISELLFTTEADAKSNLLKEGISEERIHFVGNVMIDTLINNLPNAVSTHEIFSSSPDPEVFVNSNNGFILLTLHRPSNVDNPRILQSLLEVFVKISEHIPIVFPCHPRTTSRINSEGFDSLLDTKRIYQTEPLGYLEMLGLMSNARIVLTDSGGIQEETTALGVPCLTLRENTERPITIEQGTNRIVGTDPDRIFNDVKNILAKKPQNEKTPKYWDGKASLRIKKVIGSWLKER